MAFWQETPGFDLEAENIQVLTDAKQYHERLITLIKNAQQRIYITALYLQDDEAGREVLTALHEASVAKPDLDINVLVDFHRAQRGLIGEQKSDGNASRYCQALSDYQSNVRIYGVPVKAKELFGVLHLKGFVVDDIVLYSGASLNNVYLHRGDKYRLDRYFVIKQSQLANSFCGFVTDYLISSDAVPRIDIRPLPKFNEIKLAQKKLMRELKKAK